MPLLQQLFLIIKHVSSVCLLALLFVPGTLSSQNTSFVQCWNEFQFTHPIKNKWTGQIDFSQTTSSTFTNKNPFSKYIQFMFKGWAHYYASSRWKVSAFFAYYHNTEVPEIEQSKFPELRFSGMGTYYIKKTRYTLSTRGRLEFRFLKKDEKFDDAYRYRQQLKIVYPFNNKVIRKGVVYGIGAEELFVKIPGDVTGDQFFDRARTTAGMGYSITDDVQIELSYINEILPRSGYNEIYHVIQVSFMFNNLFKNLNKKVQELFRQETGD